MTEREEGDVMPDIIPIDPYVGEFYEGWDRVGHPGRAYYGLPRPFEAGDAEGFWALDFHYPRGLSPLGFDLVCLVGSETQVVADRIPLPPGRGLMAVMAGTHLYAAEVPVTSEWEIGFRGFRAQRTIPQLIEGFPETWKAAVEELEFGFSHFRGVDLDALDGPQLAAHFGDALTYLQRAWEIHFEMMYPLLANYLAFYGVCGELGIPPGEISKFLQGYDTKIMQTDRELWRLAALARDLGLGEVFAANDGPALHQALEAAPRGRDFLDEFDTFLREYGWRTEAILEPTFVPWVEDPSPPLGMIRSFLQADDGFDFAAAHAAAVAERDEAVEQARAKLTVEERETFDASLGACRHANFAWWNEEHNHYIDLRAHVPVRQAAMAIARRAGAARPDDGLFLFVEELTQVARGDRAWSDVADLADARRRYFEEWVTKRANMPKVLGRLPEQVTDPVLIEIFGINTHFLEVFAGGERGEELRGIPVSGGVARGTARVLQSAEELHRLQPGDVLVCEATSPSWTPAFGTIAACVCDSGGTLTHASIVSREYRIPCVVGVGVATTTIRDGDVVEVDGSDGVVRIVEPA